MKIREQVKTAHGRSDKAGTDYKCLSCGGDLAFNPQTQIINCLYCGAGIAVEVERRPICDYEMDSADQSVNINWGAIKKVFHCNNCGAESILDGNTTARYCAFCGSTHLVRYEDAAGVAPEAIIPFKVPKSKAEKNFASWMKKRRFAPGALQSTYRRQSISGVYIPYWSYRAEGTSEYTAEAGMHYEVTEKKLVKKDGKSEMVEQKVKKTSYSKVSGNHDSSFKDVLVNASRQLKSSVIVRVEPFRMEELVPYASGFLAGFLAEKFSLTLDDGWEEAKKRMDREIESAIKRDIRADEVKNLSVKTSYSNRRYRLLLLPLWVSSYSYNNKIYHFMVNGQTGKVSGEAPVSALKVVAFLAAIAAIIALIVFLFR